MEPILKCEICNNEVAKIQCLDCKTEKFMCDICFASHLSDNKKDHKPGIISEEQRNDIIKSKSIYLKFANCETHRDEISKYFCEECKVIVCGECIISLHKVHNCVNLT